MRLAVFLAALWFSSAASAATLISTATGNINATGTWSVVDTTGTNALLNSETANTALTTSPVASSTFTPAAETLTAIGVKLASVAASPTGTMTIKLANSTSAGNRECTQTVNVTDLVTASTATLEGGWVILTCAASPNGTDNYTINANTSSGSQVNLFSLATTNWSRLLVTNGTKASGPAAGDSFLVYGNLTGAGTHNAFTVTVNTTSNINYGNVANTMVAPSIAIGQFGTLAFGTTASTNFTMEVAGPLVCYNGGTFTVGTAATPIPGTSTAILTLNTTVEGDTGITNRNGCTFNTNGSPRTVGKNVVQTHLTANLSAGAVTSIPVADDTGWLSGDVIVLTATDVNTGASHSEKLTLTGPATATSLPVSATLSFAHLGRNVSYLSVNNGLAYSMDNKAEVLLLTGNVKIIGSGDATPGYIYCGPTANCSMAGTELQWISGNSAGKYGLDSDTIPGGIFSFTNSSFHDSRHAGIILAETQTNWGGTSGAPATVQNVVLYNVAEAGGSAPFTGVALSIASFISNPNWLIDHVTIDTYGASSDALFLRAFAGTLTNYVASSGGSNSNGLACQTPGAGLGRYLGTWGPLTFHSNGGFDTDCGANGTYTQNCIAGVYSYHSYGPFLTGSNMNWCIDPLYSLGNTVFQAGSKGFVIMTMRNGFLANDAASGARPPFGIDESFNSLEFDNEELCPTQTVTIAQSTGTATGQTVFASCAGSGSATSITPVNDVGVVSSAPNTLHAVGRNSPFLSSADATLPGLLGQQLMSADSFACSDWINNHKCFMTYGVTSNDSVIFHSANAPYSTRLTPQITRFTGSIAGTILTVTGTPYPAISVTPNLPILGTSAPLLAGTTIIGVGTGTGGSGTYTVNNSQTISSETMTGPLGRLQSAPLYQGVKVAVVKGNTANVCVWVRESLNTDAGGVTYNGDAPRLIERANPYMGVQSDTVLATYTASAGTWQQLCSTTAVAANDGEFEFVVDADQTATSNAGGWVNIADWGCANGCISPQGSQQFFFNAVPFQSITPSLAGGFSFN